MGRVGAWAWPERARNSRAQIFSLVQRASLSGHFVRRAWREFALGSLQCLATLALGAANLDESARKSQPNRCAERVLSNWATFLH